MPELWSSRVSGVPTLTEQALLSAPANVLVMYPGEQRMGWVPGMGVQGSWGKDGGGPTGIQLLEWQPRERNGVGYTRKSLLVSGSNMWPLFGMWNPHPGNSLKHILLATRRVSLPIT